MAKAATKSKPKKDTKPASAKKSPKINIQSERASQLPDDSYLSADQIKKSILTLKKYLNKRTVARNSDKKATKKSLLDAGEPTTSDVIVEVVFKNVPANSKTYVHTVQLPNHWRLQLDPDNYDIALFVPHRRADNEAQAIQFAKDRDLDIDNTHTYYKELLEQKLDESMRSRVSRIITTKELATEFNTFQKLDRLSKTYDLFLSDKKLMANKMNPVPRRLGRRFWVREKKVPLMIKLDASNLQERFQKVMNTEPFYVTGRTSTERITIGNTCQKVEHLAQNVQVFLKKLHDMYADGVRFIKIRGDKGLSLPIYADLSEDCPKVVMKRKRIKPTTIVDEFDLAEQDDVKVSVSSSGTVKLIKPDGSAKKSDPKTKRKAQDSPVVEKRKKKIRK